VAAQVDADGFESAEIAVDVGDGCDSHFGISVKNLLRHRLPQSQVQAQKP
jgi:hypothetical protein